MKNQKPTSILAREEDGTIQLTITIPVQNIEKAEQEVLSELAKTTAVPGFRPGWAPIEEVKKRTPAQTVLEHVLKKILPQAYQQALGEHEITPFLGPRFELISTGEGKDWQVRALTCEAPKIELGDYKKEIEGTRRASSLWIPGKDNGKKAEPTTAEKENLIIEALLKTSKVTIPKPIIEEEVNHRLATLVDQTQTLGLSVGQYLRSTGKTVEEKREEYKKQAQEQIAIMLILSQIAQKEGIEVNDKEVERVIKEQEDGNGQITQAQMEVIRGILKRKRALDKLAASI